MKYCLYFIALADLVFAFVDLANLIALLLHKSLPLLFIMKQTLQLIIYLPIVILEIHFIRNYVLKVGTALYALKLSSTILLLVLRIALSFSGDCDA